MTGTNKTDLRNAFKSAKNLMQIADRMVKTPVNDTDREAAIDLIALDRLANELDGEIAVLHQFIDDAWQRRADKMTVEMVNGNIRCWCGCKYWNHAGARHNVNVISCFDCGAQINAALLIDNAEEDR